MRIERFDAVDATRGMREINARYGDDALIISNSRNGGKNQFVIAIDTPDPHRPVFTAEALVREFGKAVSDRSAPIQTDNLLESLALSDLGALMSAGFDELKKQIEQVHLQPMRASDPLLSPRSSQGEASLRRLMRLLSGCALPVDLLQMLAEVTASCADDQACVTMVCSWLSAKLPEAQPLTELRGVHCLVGAPGVGKTTAGIRLAAKLGRDSAQPPALLVAYNLTRESDLSSLQAAGETAGVRVLQADDFSALVTLINEHISSASLVIELPGHLHASEYVTQDGALKFSDVMLTKLDLQNTYWPLIQALIHYDVPLMLGSYSGGIGQSLVLIDKFSILDEVLRGMSGMMEKEDNRESITFSANGFRPANKTRAELM